MGFGTVGRSVAKLLSQDANSPFVLTHICNRNIARKKADWLPPHIRWTENIDEVLSSDVDVVVELIGGLEPAGEWIRKALRAGKSVVTANKLLIADRGPQLLELAERDGPANRVRSIGRRRNSGDHRHPGGFSRRSSFQNYRHSERHLQLHSYPDGIERCKLCRRA